MRKVKLCTLVVLAVMSLAFPLNAVASNSQAGPAYTAVDIDARDYPSEAAFDSAVCVALNNPSVQTVMVRGSDAPGTPLNSALEVVPMNSSPTVYSVANVKTTNDVRGTGTDYFIKLQVWPGDSPILHVLETRGYTFSLSSGASYAALSLLLGWSGVTSSQVGFDYQVTCPSTYGGHSVSYMWAVAWPVYTVKNYDLYLTVPGYIYNQYQGRGTAKKPIPNTYMITKTYVYN